MISRLGLSRAALKVSLLTLMLLITGATSVFVYPDPQTTLSPYEDPYYASMDGPFELAQQMLSILDASYDQVCTALDRLTDEGVVIPETAEDVFRMGEEALALAYYHMGTGDYESSIEKSSEALRLFGEVLQFVLEAQQDTAEVEDGAEALIVELRVRIERGYSRLSELYETLRQLEEKLLDVSDLQVLLFMQSNFLLEKADEYLDSASVLLEEGDLEAVESELAIAEVFLDEALKLLLTISKSEKSEKAEKFAEANVKRLDRLEDMVSDMFGEEAYTELNATVVQGILQNAKNVNKAVKALIESGEIESATSNLEKVTGLAEDVVEMIEDVDEDLGKSLKKVERLEAKKSKLEEKIERLESKGRDTTRFEEKLEGVNEELDSEIEDLDFSMSTGTEEPEVKDDEDEDKDPPAKSEEPEVKDDEDEDKDPPAKSEEPEVKDDEDEDEDPPAKSEDTP
jgi:tetratricopeptide (TPR) repeat protein